MISDIINYIQSSIYTGDAGNLYLPKSETGYLVNWFSQIGVNSVTGFEINNGGHLIGMINLNFTGMITGTSNGNIWTLSGYSPTETHPLVGGTITMTNLASAVTSLVVDQRTMIDLSKTNEFRFGTFQTTTGQQAGRLWLSYSTGVFTSTAPPWTDLGTGQLALGSTGYKVSPWESVPASARNDLMIRVITSGGNGLSDPVIQGVFMSVR